MDDPTMRLREGIAYRAITGNWHPTPRLPVWSDNTHFTVDLDGHGKVIQGIVQWGFNDMNPFGRESEQWYLELTYGEKTYKYNFGYWTYPSVSQEEFSSFLECVDIDGDGCMEVFLGDEQDGGGGQIILSFRGDEPETLLTQGWRF
jgi:hypothetical protein